MFRYLPPAGHRLSLYTTFRAMLRLARGDNPAAFVCAFGDLLKAKYCFLTSSGTAALYLGLLALKELSFRKEVIIPAYTCPSLLAAVIRAGLTPVLCDFDKDSPFYNFKELCSKISADTLAVVSVHLFGITEDVNRINELASSREIFHIEDAAQTLLMSGKDEPQAPDSPRGDLSVYSFGRGKPFTLMEGGALSTNSDLIAQKCAEKVERLPSQGFFETMILIFKTFLYSLFFHPRLYWIPQHLPFLKLGKTFFNLQFKIKRINAFTCALGVLSLDHAVRCHKLRIQQGESMYRALSSFKNLMLINGPNRALLRFPLLLPSKEKREQVLSALHSKGIGATGMYPAPLNLFRTTQGYFNSNHYYKHARSFAERIVTLPLHEHLKGSDIENIRKTLEQHLSTR